MKITLFLLVYIIFMQNLLHAQVNTWQRSHGTSKDDHCNNVIVAQDGNYIACGYSYGTDSLGTADFHMIKVDSTNGDLLWTWSEGNGGQETITTIEETKTGALLVAGNTSPVQLYLSSDVMLCKVSANGNLIWKQTYQLPDSQFCNDIAILPDGNICLVGLNRTAAGDSSGFFMKVDATGNLIDFKLYDIIGSEYFSGIVFTKDSMLAVNGTSIQPFPASNKIWMLKFDWNGDTIFTKLNTFYKYYTGVPLVQNINGNFILNVRELNTWSWVHILLYDSNFNLLDDLNWANYYSSPLCISVSGINEKFTVGRSDSYGLMIEHYKDTGAIEDLMSYNQVFRPSKFYGGGIDFALSTKYYAINNSKEGIVVAGSTTFNLNNSFDFCLVKYSDSLKLNFNTLTPTPNFVTDTICESDSILLYVMLNDKLNNIWLINDDTIYGLGDSIYAKHSGSYTPIGFDIEQNFIAGTSARVVVLDTSIVGSMYISINKPYCKYDGDTAIIIAPLNSKATYQWQLNGVNIPGATSNQVKANGTGNYQCVYNFGCATKVSNVVYINDSAAITVSLNTSTGIYRSYCSGSKMDPSLLIMQASNNVTYNWYNNGNLVNTGTNLPTIKENDSIWYVVSVNGCGIDTSLFAYYIDEPLQQTTACNYVGDTIEFCNNDSVEFCSGSTNWKRNGTTIPNVTLPFYATLAGSYQYYYQTGNCGAWSIPIFIVDNLPDSINFNTYPNDTVCTSKVSIYALPYNNLSTYSWYYKGNYLNDTASITADSTGWYRCVVHSPNCLQQIVDSIYIVKLGSAAKCIAQDSMYNTCTDSVIIKDASPDSNANYVWYKNNSNMQLPSNTTQILANEAANYKFTKTIYGCNLNSNTILTQASFNELIDTDTNTCVPCNGSVSILIDSVLQPQYLWSNSNTTNKNEMLCPGVYYVTVTNSTCSKVITTSILQGINLDANYSTSPPSAAGCDGNFSSIIYGGTPPYNKSFIPIATDSTLCVNTTYNFLVEDSKGCIVTKTNAYYYHSDNDTLWPGDADKNGYVDNYDLMSIVMHNYENGIARDTLTIQWQPIFPTINWMGTLQINNVDRKHSDCNGNGLIDTIDADAIILNYGITGKNSYAKPFDPAGPELKFISAKTNYAAGEMVEIIVVAGTSQKPIYKQKFLGVQVELPLQVIEPGTISATDIYNQSFPLWDDYKFAQSDGAIQCDFAHAVFNNFNLFNWHGEVFRISFQVANNLQSVQSHQVEIKNYRLIDMTDASIIMNYQPLTLAFNPVSIADQMHDNGISIFPNPANGELNIYANKQMIRYVELTDAAGRAIVQLATMENQIKLNISDVSNGLYQCKIILNNDQEIKSKVNIMH